MAYIKFRNEGEPSIKKSIPSGVYRKRWKVAFIMSGVFNVLSLGFFIYKYFNN